MFGWWSFQVLPTFIPPQLGAPPARPQYCWLFPSAPKRPQSRSWTWPSTDVFPCWWPSKRLKKLTCTVYKCVSQLVHLCYFVSIVFPGENMTKTKSTIHKWWYCNATWMYCMIWICGHGFQFGHPDPCSLHSCLQHLAGDACFCWKSKLQEETGTKKHVDVSLMTGHNFWSKVAQIWLTSSGSSLRSNWGTTTFWRRRSEVGCYGYRVVVVDGSSLDFVAQKKDEKSCGS